MDLKSNRDLIFSRILHPAIYRPSPIARPSSGQQQRQTVQPRSNDNDESPKSRPAPPRLSPARSCSRPLRSPPLERAQSQQQQQNDGRPQRVKPLRKVDLGGTDSRPGGRRRRRAGVVVLVQRRQQRESLRAQDVGEGEGEGRPDGLGDARPPDGGRGGRLREFLWTERNGKRALPN